MVSEKDLGQSPVGKVRNRSGVTQAADLEVKGQRGAAIRKTRARVVRNSPLARGGGRRARKNSGMSGIPSALSPWSLASAFCGSFLSRALSSFTSLLSAIFSPLSRDTSVLRASISLFRPTTVILNRRFSA